MGYKWVKLSKLACSKILSRAYYLIEFFMGYQNIKIILISEHQN